MVCSASFCLPSRKFKLTIMLNKIVIMPRIAVNLPNGETSFIAAQYITNPNSEHITISAKAISVMVLCFSRFPVAVRANAEPKAMVANDNNNFKPTPENIFAPNIAIINIRTTAQTEIILETDNTFLTVFINPPKTNIVITILT